MKGRFRSHDAGVVTGGRTVPPTERRRQAAAEWVAAVWRSWRVPLVAACGLFVLHAQLLGQGRIANAVMETRSAAQGLERAVATIAARGTAAWVGYGVPIIAGNRQLCAGVMLEPPTQLMILARLENGRVVKLRTLTPNCEVDAGGMPVVWLTDVKPVESVAWLAAFVTPATDNPDVMRDLSRPALAAIGLHATDGAPRLIQIVRTTTDRNLRKRAMSWLGQSRDPQAVRFFEELLNVK